MLTFAGMKSADAPAAAQAVLAFETQLANASWSFADLNNATKTYNPQNFAAFQASTPALPWQALFQAQNLAIPARVNIQVPPFFAALQRILPATPIPALRNYLKIHLLFGMAQQLPRRFRDAYFELYGKELAGQQQPPPRASFCEATTVGDLGDLIAQQYVEISLPAADKKIVDEMIADLRGNSAPISKALPGWTTQPAVPRSPKPTR